MTPFLSTHWPKIFIGISLIGLIIIFSYIVHLLNKVNYYYNLAQEISKPTSQPSPFPLQPIPKAQPEERVEIFQNSFLRITNNQVVDSVNYKTTNSTTLLESGIVKKLDSNYFVLVDVLRTGCEEPNDQKCINFLERIYSENSKYGGLWKLNFSTSKATHLISPSKFGFDQLWNVSNFTYNQDTDQTTFTAEFKNYDSSDIVTKIVTYPESSPAPTQAPISQLSTKILPFLKSQDFAALAKYVHPTLGLRFSPYSYI